MSPSGLTRLSLLASLLLFACTGTKPAEAPRAEVLSPSADGYVTLVPSVSVSKAAAPEPPQKQAALDPNEDVMAEILAIPPGE